MAIRGKKKFRLLQNSRESAIYADWERGPALRGSGGMACQVEKCQQKNGGWPEGLVKIIHSLDQYFT